MTRIEELARKLNQEILALEVVQEYQKYEKLVLNDEKLKQLEKELKSLNNKKERIRKAYIDALFTLKNSKNKKKMNILHKYAIIYM